MQGAVILAVAAGGAAGATARYVGAAAVGRLLGTGFPWGILTVNVAGCFVMGVLTAVFALAWSPGPAVRALLTVGFLGGFTTFSSFSLDAVLLAERGDLAPASAYVLASVTLSLVGLVAGMSLVRAVAA